MNVAGQVALWVALIVAAWNTGFFGSRWSRGRGGVAPMPSWSVFAAAAPLALAWASLTGAALRGDGTLAVVASRVVVDAGPVYRTAAVLTSRPGALLTLAFLLSLITLTTATARTDAKERTDRCIAVHSAVMMLLAALMAGAWPPFAPAGVVDTTAVAPELLHPGAALRGLLAIAAVAAAAHGVAWLLAARGELQLSDGRAARNAFAIALVLSTLSLASDQWARTTLAAGDGRNAGGILLWVTLALLSHDRVRILLQSSRGADRFQRAGRAALFSHIGAACIVVAFAAHVAARRATITLAPGQSVETTDVFGRSWRLVNQGISRFDDRARDVTAIAADVQGPGGQRLITSELAGYHVHDGAETTLPISRRGVVMGVVQTMLLTLESAGPDDSATVRLAFIPLALLWFPGVTFLVLGVLLGSRAPAAVPATEPTPFSAAPASPEIAEAGEELVRQWRAAPVDCPHCGRRPEPDSRFCSSCGRALLPCARCGAVTAEPVARYCAACGAELVWPAGRPNVSARSLPAGVGPVATE